MPGRRPRSPSWGRRAPSRFSTGPSLATIRRRAGAADGSGRREDAGDPAEEENLTGSKREKDVADLLFQAMREVEAPDDQFVRLGFSG